MLLYLTKHSNVKREVKFKQVKCAACQHLTVATLILFHIQPFAMWCDLTTVNKEIETCSYLQHKSHDDDMMVFVINWSTCTTTTTHITRTHFQQMH